MHCRRSSSKQWHAAAVAASTGYSGTPQAKKLGIKPGHRVHLDQAPTGWALTDPPGELIHVEAPDPADVIVSFYREAGAHPGPAG
jgi:hypothetical protein